MKLVPNFTKNSLNPYGDIKMNLVPSHTSNLCKNTKIKFVTNFTKDSLKLYKKAIAQYDADNFEIHNEAYDIYGHRLPDDYLALYYCGTEAFDWNKFSEILHQFMITTNNI